MSQAENAQVDRFVGQVRARLNRQLWWWTFRWAVLVGGGVMLAVALVYVLRGYAVPAVWYGGVLAGTLGGAVVAWAARRWSPRQTERFIDRFFDLRDSVSSLRGFERAGRSGGFYNLHQAQVQQLLAELDASHVRPEPAGGVAAAATAVVALAGALAFVGPSESVVARQLAAEQTRQQTEQMNSELDQYVQEMLDEVEEEAPELFDASELRQWVDELESVEDQQEALRQYAAFEQEVNRLSERMRQERDENLLAEAGREMARDRETRELGEQLERKQYRDAADELEELSPEDLEDMEDLADAREDLDALQKAAQRMAEAARQARQRRSANGEGGEGSEADADGGKGSQGSGSRGSGGTAGGGGGSDGEAGEQADGDPMDDDLAELLEELEQDLEEYDEALGECENGGGEEAYRLARERGDEAAERLARLRQRLDTLEDARELRQRLAGLSEQLGMCQSSLAGQPRLAQSGKKAGSGTADSFENDEDTPAEGQLTRLEGQRTEDGPARTKVEDADSGAGVSRRASAEIDVEFERQVESFVQREDVPRPVRDGVQRYFENIHEGPAEAPTTE